MKRLNLILLVVLLVLATACSPNPSESYTTAQSDTTAPPATTTTSQPETTATTQVETTTESAPIEVASGQPIVTISTKIGDRQLNDMIFALDPAAAPNTVANFVSLAQDGYYDGLIFHRIIAEFMIQGGDPTGSGMGGPGYSIAGEFKSNGFDNPLSHQRGVISMARSQKPDSAGSQFFICHRDATFLDGEYAAFGRLVSGEMALDELATTKTGPGDRPDDDCVIVTVNVDLNGYQLPEVDKIAE